MITIEDLTKNNFPLIMDKGCLCVTSMEGATRVKCCGSRKKLPAERGGRDDRNNKLKTK